jgi:ABC-type multidrug transport system fused ATPase/permease subunit
MNLPFIFAASVNDLLIPDFIGKICDAMIAQESDLVAQYIRTWVIVMCIGGAFVFLNKLTIGFTTERMGTSLRLKLYSGTIFKDISFYDETKTGELISRLNSDSVIVQEGLSAAVASVLQLFAFNILVLIMMF